MFKSLFFIFFVSDIALSCPACFGKNNFDDEEALNKIYKQKSEFYSQSRTLAPSARGPSLECDFSKGNDNCKKVKP